MSNAPDLPQATPKVALVTGGAQRIGASIVRRLHQTGYNLILHYHHSETAAQSLASELNAARDNSVICIKADLLDRKAIDYLAASAQAAWLRLDVLINNASSFYPTPLTELNPEQWSELSGTNAFAPAFLCKACAAALQKSKGCIVNISDIAAVTGREHYLAYTMAKAALNNLTRTLARELAPEVRVNGVAPGAILPPNTTVSAVSTNNQNTENLAANTLDSEVPDALSISCLNYPASADDIAYAVSFLTTSTYITGQTLNVDGGRRLKI